MKNTTVLLIIGALVAFYLINKKRDNAEKPVETIITQEPLYADDFTTGQTYYVPVGSTIKTFLTYHEVIVADSQETFRIPIV